MAQPPDPSRRSSSPDESFLDLLVETLENLERPARGQFLQKYFRTIAHLDLTEPASLDLWEQTLSRRQELAERLGRAVSLKTAMVDVLSTTQLLRVPILVEYEDLKKLQISAATDPLTGLYNRRLFNEIFEREMGRAKRYPQHLSLVLLDLHRFKEVNDRCGHPQGDEVLQRAAVTFRQTLRTSDYAFRIGGDEFAVLLPQTDAEQAATMSRRVRSSFQTAVESLQLVVPVSLDFGIAVFPEDGEQPEVLLRIADERLYQFKNSARTLPRERGADAAAREVRRGSTAGQERPSPLTPTPPETPRTMQQSAETFKGKATGATPPSAPVRGGAERRRWERVPLGGTKAYAMFSEKQEKSARVLDLSFGGVALQVDKNEEPPVSFSAVLHVPILPPVRVSLRKTYTQSLGGGQVRIGCSFVT